MLNWAATQKTTKQGLPSGPSELRLRLLFGETLWASGLELAAANEDDDLWQLKFG
jgi:hypothetical protein